MQKLKEKNVTGKIVLLRVAGEVDGRVRDIGRAEITKQCYESGAVSVLWNTYHLSSLALRKLELLAQNEVFCEEELVSKFAEKQELSQEECEQLKRLLSCDFSRFEEEKAKDFERRAKKQFEEQLKES